MIICPVCGLQNDDLAVLCVSCRSFLQSKVDNLNLFGTFWELMESPDTAFKRIILANHKNYRIVLGSLLGISMVCAVFWMKSVAPHFSNVLTLVGTAGVLGVPCGIVFVFAFGVFVGILARIMGRNVTVRNSSTVISYAAMPIVFSLAFVFPIEIAIFGIDFFGTNPSPMVINSHVYLSLLGFDVIAAVWAVILFMRGMLVLTGFRGIKALMFGLLCLAFPGSILAVVKHI